MRAIELSGPTGVISMIIPTSLMGGGSFRNLRRYILAETRPSRFDRVVARKNVFEDALQETMMITLRRDKKPGLGLVYRTEIKGAPKAWRGPGLKNPHQKRNLPSPHGDADLKRPIGRFRLPQDPEAPWFLPREAKDDHLLKRLTTMPARLKDWGLTVSTGPILWDRVKDQLRDQPSARTVPLIFAKALQGPLLSEYRVMRNRPCDLELSDKVSRDHLVTSPCVLLKRTSANEQSRRLFATELTEAFLNQCGGAVAIENHVNIIRPSNPAAFGLCLSTLTRLFNSPILDCIFRLQSGSAAVSAFELNHLPLPELSDIQRLGQETARGGGLETFDAALEALYRGP
jgi:adenine-specific DNA-methyltransferase